MQKLVKPIKAELVEMKAIEKRKVGKPLKWKTPEIFEEQLFGYINKQKELGEPITVSGICLALDTSRQLLVEYGVKPEYGDIVKRAKLEVANYVESGILKNKINAIAGIFHLTNLDPENWKQKQEVTHTGSIALGIVQLPSKEIPQE